MNTKRFLEEKIAGVLEKDSSLIALTTPNNAEHGDYATNIAMTMFGNQKQILKQVQDDNKSPKEFAEKLVQTLTDKINELEIIEKVEVAGPGFINFTLKTDYLIKELQSVSDKANDYGKSDENKGKKAIVEYSSANIAKPFTVGHLRSTVIGGAVANLLEATGWEVLRDNHIGDWGTQFGKQIYAIKEWGNMDKIAASENPVKDLVDLYVKFHEEADKDSSLEDKAREWFKKLEDGDSEARELWKKCIDWSWKEFTRIYELLDIKFSKEFDDGKGLGESFFEDKMQVVIDELESKGLLRAGEEGAKLVFFDKDKYPPAMILKKDGATLYHTRDLATDKYRLDKYNPDLIINEVGSEQTLYFQQLFEMEDMLGWFKEDQRVHIKHGLIRFKEGKMSTRKGNVIWLSDILNKAIDKARELGSSSEELARMVGIGAIKYNDLKRDSELNIAFEWDEILNMQGNSGPYIQYTYARTRSVLEKSDKVYKDYKNYSDYNPEELSVVRQIVKYPETVETASKNYSPNLVCSYLYELASGYNTFYNKHKIIGSENEEFRVFLTGAVGQVIKNGLHLLGIKAPEKM